MVSKQVKNLRSVELWTKALEVLVQMKSRLSVPERWCKRHMALNRWGVPTVVTDERAVAWCIEGAMEADVQKRLDREVEIRNGEVQEDTEARSLYCVVGLVLHAATADMYLGDPKELHSYFVFNEDADYGSVVTMLDRAVRRAMCGVLLSRTYRKIRDPKHWCGGGASARNAAGMSVSAYSDSATAWSLVTALGIEHQACFNSGVYSAVDRGNGAFSEVTLTINDLTVNRVAGLPSTRFTETHGGVIDLLDEVLYYLTSASALVAHVDLFADRRLSTLASFSDTY